MYIYVFIELCSCERGDNYNNRFILLVIKCVYSSHCDVFIDCFIELCSGERRGTTSNQHRRHLGGEDYEQHLHGGA